MGFSLHSNQLKIKLNKKCTQAFYFGLKFWSQLEIIETLNFSQTNSFWDETGAISSQFKKYFTFIV